MVKFGRLMNGPQEFFGWEHQETALHIAKDSMKVFILIDNAYISNISVCFSFEWRIRSGKEGVWNVHLEQ